MTGAIGRSRYYAALYTTTTGKVIGYMPISANPTWLQQVDDDGSWNIQTQVTSDNGGGLTKKQLWFNTDEWRFSMAVCFGNGTRPGDYICQAGPIISSQATTSNPPTLQFGGSGLWALLRATMQLNSSWPGVSVNFTGGADSTYNGTLRDIAIQILSNAAARNTMPIDIPSVSGGGTATRTYNGYDLASAGQRLYELTQVDQGPDIFLRPYFSDTNTIRHQAVIGNPGLVTAGAPAVFQYPGNIIDILPTRNGQNLSTRTFERGNGSQYTTLFSQASDPTLVTAGWPNLEYTDINHSDVQVQADLDTWARSNQAINGRRQITWDVTLPTGGPAPMGTFDPGGNWTYNVQHHWWLPDGSYTHRILGFQNGQKIDQYKHILQDQVN
jgi:hypothetical protein